MRTIIGNITLLVDDNYSDKQIQFVLCDGYGNPLSALDISGQIAVKKTVTTDNDGNFSISLLETEESDIAMFYKMIFVDNEDIGDINLFIRKGADPVDFQKLLFPTPNLKMFYEKNNDLITFKNTVVDIFNRFFVNETTFFTLDEKNLTNEFVKYADSLVDNEIISFLDKHLATIGVE